MAVVLYQVYIKMTMQLQEGICEGTYCLFYFSRPDVSSIVTLRGRDSAQSRCWSDLEKKALIHSVADWNLLDFLQMWYNTRHSGYIMGIGASSQSITLSELSAKLLLLSWNIHTDDRITSITKKKNMSSWLCTFFLYGWMHDSRKTTTASTATKTEETEENANDVWTATLVMR